jgi:hypothetical protein
MFGCHGRYLHVDVSDGAAFSRPLGVEVLRRFLGGEGLGTHLLYREAPARIDPFSPEAPLLFIMSPLVGTPLTTSAKFAVVAKSPLTYRLNDALSSSHFALAAKRAGNMLCKCLILALSLIVFQLLMLPTNSATPNDDNAQTFFPIEVGTKWVYKIGEAEETRIVTKAEKKGDATFLSIGRVLVSGAVVPYDQVKLSATELAQVPIPASDVVTPSIDQVTPAVVLRLPPIAGDKWDFETVDSRPFGIREKGTVSVGPTEEIEVPAGKFSAIRIETTVVILRATPLMVPAKTVYWYSPGLGMVKKVFSDDRIVVLKKFSLAKK